MQGNVILKSHPLRASASSAVDRFLSIHFEILSQ